MADPVGLVSLGLTGLGKATTAARLRKRHGKVVKALATHADAADIKIRNAGGDVEAHRAVLLPLFGEAAILLQRFAAQKPLQALADAMEEMPEDIDAARKLIDAFKAADTAIELHCTLRRIDERVGAGHDTALARIHSLQRDVDRLEKTIYRCMISVVFFSCGKTGGNPHTTQKL